jgi:hypothetical protein
MSLSKLKQEIFPHKFIDIEGGGRERNHKIVTKVLWCEDRYPFPWPRFFEDGPQSHLIFNKEKNISINIV